MENCKALTGSVAKGLSVKLADLNCASSKIPFQLNAYFVELL